MVVGKAPPATNGMPAIVLLEPQPPVEPPLEVARPVMDQVSLEFIPKLLFVRTGQPVEFLNSDEVIHNINVKDDATNEQSFNVAIPNGVTYRHTFTRDGFYTVVCDIHPLMVASFSSSSPFNTIAQSDGAFVFENVAPGPPRGHGVRGRSTAGPLDRGPSRTDGGEYRRSVASSRPGRRVTMSAFPSNRGNARVDSRIVP